MTTFHIDADGNLLRATSDPDAVIPGAVTKTNIAPASGRQKWNGSGWDAAPPRIVPAPLRDIPANVNSVPALRDAVNELKAHLRGE